MVHEARGRLRVHLPRWSGVGADRLEREMLGLVGVTAARASAATGNLLVCFDVDLTDRGAVLHRLRGLRVPRALRCWASAGGADGGYGSRFAALTATIGSGLAWWESWRRFPVSSEPWPVR